MIKKIINQFHKSLFFGSIFHTLNYCLQEELRDCDTVLDIGCGPSSPLQYCKNIKHSVGVEAFKPYLIASQKNKIHNEYLDKNIADLDFLDNSFDAVIMIDVLEHLTDEKGIEILKKVEKWAIKKVVISSPNGFVIQQEADNNPLQKHLSGWSYGRMKKLGYVSHGLAGLKFLRCEGVNTDTMIDGDMANSIRFKPKKFWFIVSAVSQIFVYFIPSLAYSLFNVKLKNDERNTIN